MDHILIVSPTIIIK